MNQPRCGHCGYDLTRSESNRCPECGLLFIEAGVEIASDSVVKSQRMRRSLMLSLLFLFGLGVAMGLFTYMRAQAARAQAIAAQQAAQQAAQLAVQNTLYHAFQDTQPKARIVLPQSRDRSERRKPLTDPAPPERVPPARTDSTE